MVRGNCGLLAVPGTVPHFVFSYVVGFYQNAESAKDKPELRYDWLFMCHVKCFETLRTTTALVGVYM